MNPPDPVLLVNVLAAIPGQASIEVDSPLLFKNPADLATLLSDLMASLSYQGTWNAATNTPAIPAASGANNRWYYVVSVAGTTDINGISAWNVGDWIVSNGTAWVRSELPPLTLPVPASQGGTGVDNGASTITLGGNLVFTGAFGATFTVTAATNLTLPASGTLLTTTGNGSQLTSLNASNITSGALATSVLPTNLQALANNSAATLDLDNLAIHDLTLNGLVISDLTGNSPIFAGPTSTSVLQSTSVGLASQALTSNGPGAIATFQTPQWSWLIGTPTTLSGYGITDAITAAGVATFTNKTISFAGNTLTGVASSGANSNITSLTGLTTALSVPQGGSGAATFNAYSPLFAGITNTSAFQSLSFMATAGVPLVSNGAGTLPSFQQILPAMVTSVESFGNTAVPPSTPLSVGSPATGMYLVGAWLKINSVTTDVIQVQVSWTDAAYSTQTKTFVVEGATSGLLSATGYYAFPPMTLHSVITSTISVTVAYSTSGGSINYDFGAFLMRLK